MLTSLRDWYLPEKLGSVGRQAFNVDVALFRTDGVEAGPGEPGEIASRGDNVMMEYYNEPEQTAAVFRLGGGWLLTGDVGVRDEQGFITLIDRAKDMLISGGENVYPKEIEDVHLRTRRGGRMRRVRHAGREVGRGAGRLRGAEAGRHAGCRNGGRRAASSSWRNSSARGW